ncbi:MAG: DUF1648 domain-containing protein [Verrucomicrobia bacterium]|nr:DUF1648 domain-containing protein [Verrucomicrobiota bacterium]
MQRKRNIAEALLLLLPFLIIALAWKRLPPMIPMHWNIRGQVDRWDSKPFAFLLPALAIALNAFLRAIPLFDPKLRRKADAFGPIALSRIRLALTVLFVVLSLVQLAAALNYPIGTGRVVITCALLLLAALGNFLGNLRPNYFAGIRTPWTLESGETWRVTHRLGAKLIVFGSLGLLVVQFIVDPRTFGALTLLAIIALVIWSFVYSWRHFTRHVERS